MSFLVKDGMNFIGTAVSYFPNAISILELNRHLEKFLDEFNLYFKFHHVTQPNPNGFVGLITDRMDFESGIYTEDGLTLNLKTLGISVDGVFLDMYLPSELYQIDDLDEMAKVYLQYLEVYKRLLGKIENFLLDFSNIQKNEIQRIEIPFFRAKIKFKDDLRSFFNEDLNKFFQFGIDQSPPLIGNTQNQMVINISHILVPSSDLDETDIINFSQNLSN
ncbi:MAG: hypothetical protein ACFFCS_00355, partial [Candidatus Hodarchaeota archaeon]